MKFQRVKVTQLFAHIAGSCKIGRNCTAAMTVSILSDGSVKADAVLTHYGHRKELQHTRVTKRKRQEKLKQGVPRERILDDIRESQSAGDPPCLTRSATNAVRTGEGLPTPLL